MHRTRMTRYAGGVASGRGGRERVMRSRFESAGDTRRATVALRGGSGLFDRENQHTIDVTRRFVFARVVARPGCCWFIRRGVPRRLARGAKRWWGHTSPSSGARLESERRRDHGHARGRPRGRVVASVPRARSGGALREASLSPPPRRRGRAALERPREGRRRAPSDQGCDRRAVASARLRARAGPICALCRVRNQAFSSASSARATPSCGPPRRSSRARVASSREARGLPSTSPWRSSPSTKSCRRRRSSAFGTSPRTIPTRFEPTMAMFARARSPDSPSAYPSCSRDKYSTPPRTPPSAETVYTTDAGSEGPSRGTPGSRSRSSATRNTRAPP